MTMSTSTTLVPVALSTVSMVVGVMRPGWRRRLNRGSINPESSIRVRRLGSRRAVLGGRGDPGCDDVGYRCTPEVAAQPCGRLHSPGVIHGHAVGTGPAQDVERIVGSPKEHRLGEDL